MFGSGQHSPLGDGSGSFGTGASGWVSGATDEGMHCECFNVPASLMGLAIGTQGSNIRAARAVPGVVRVEVREPPPSSIPKPAPSNGAVPADGPPEPQAPPEEVVATFKVVAEVNYIL